jgi:hypothetical protein
MSVCRAAILKVYRILEILEIKVLEIKVAKGFTIKSFTIKVRRNVAAGALEDISAGAPPEGRRRYPQRLPPRLKRAMCLAMG